MVNLYLIIKNLINDKYFTSDDATWYVVTAYNKGAVTKSQAQELILLIEQVYDVKLVHKKR